MGMLLTLKCRLGKAQIALSKMLLTIQNILHYKPYSSHLLFTYTIRIQYLAQVSVLSTVLSHSFLVSLIKKMDLKL